VTGQQGQVDQRQDVVDGVVVLGDAERPAQLRPVGPRVGVRQLADGLGRDAGLLLGVIERVLLDAGFVLLEVQRRALDELLVDQPGGDDLAADRVGQRDVRADVESQPAVGPLGRAGAARVNDVELRAVADALEDVQEKDRMRLPGIRAPEDDQIGLLGLAI
jgi:hypothetical protein